MLKLVAVVGVVFMVRACYGITDVTSSSCGVPGFSLQTLTGTRCQLHQNCRIRENQPLSSFPACIKDMLIAGSSQAKLTNGCLCEEGGERTKATERDTEKLREIGKQLFDNKEQNCYQTMEPVKRQAKTYQCSSTQDLIENVYVEFCYKDYVISISNGIPAHCHQDGEYRQVPNAPCERYIMMAVPAKNPGAPSTTTFTKAGLGGLGYIRTGGYTYGPLNDMRQCDSAAVSESAGFDPYGGHSDVDNDYHYHRPSEAFVNWDKCAMMGFYTDGARIHGICTVTVGGKEIKMTSCYEQIQGTNGCSTSHYQFNKDKEGCNLDEANGYTFSDTATAVGNANITFSAGDYAHFTTETYPYIVPGAFINQQNAAWYCNVNF